MTTGGTNTVDTSAHPQTARIGGAMVSLSIKSWPPSINHYYLTTRFGKRRLNKAAELWMNETMTDIKQQHKGLLRLTVPCNVWVDLHAPSDGRRAKFDVDNKAKPLLDVLQHANVIEDDVLVQQLTLRKYACPDNIKREGHVDIWIHPMIGF